MSLWLQSVAIILYISFLVSQWYIMGKEVDHRFKIYYKAKSSVERVLYRFILGSTSMIIIYSCISLFPSTQTFYLFWCFHLVFTLYHSWPTRGKIIKESLSSQFSEYRYLDSFERTVLLISAVMFITSIPQYPLFENIDALKLFLDPSEQVHHIFWSFLSVGYSPFSDYPKLLNNAWNFHFYFLGVGPFLLSFYILARYFLSRRLSLLGVFGLISSWSLPLVLERSALESMQSTYIVLWVWSVLWCVKSNTYRSGLLLSLSIAMGSVLNWRFSLLMPLTLALVTLLFYREKTWWYKRQWLKYNILGLTVVAFVLLTHMEMSWSFGQVSYLLDQAQSLIQRKAFFNLSVVMLLLIVLLQIPKVKQRFYHYSFDAKSFVWVSSLFCVQIIAGLVMGNVYFGPFAVVWVVCLLSLLPVDWLFQSISRHRLKRNIIYTLYILICLLDSHFEIRLRRLFRVFFSDEVAKYINNL